MESEGQEVTRMLRRVAAGDREAEEQLFSLIYGQLKKLAAGALRREKPGHTLQPTALVHEAYLRLLGAGSIDYADRAHFFRVAARTMRRVLIDHARKHVSEKGGGGWRRLDLDAIGQFSVEESASVLRLHDCLDILASRDPRQALIVEMRYFGGLTEEEIALVLEISSRTVKRDWVSAQAWLNAEMVRG